MTAAKQLQLLLETNAKRGRRARRLKALFFHELRRIKRSDEAYLVLLYHLLDIEAKGYLSSARSAVSTKGRKASSFKRTSSQAFNPALDSSSPEANASATYAPKNDSFIEPFSAAFRKVAF